MEEELGFIGWQQKEEMGINGKIAPVCNNFLKG